MKLKFFTTIFACIYIVLFVLSILGSLEIILLPEIFGYHFLYYPSYSSIIMFVLGIIDVVQMDVFKTPRSFIVIFSTFLSIIFMFLLYLVSGLYRIEL